MSPPVNRLTIQDVRYVVSKLRAMPVDTESDDFPTDVAVFRASETVWKVVDDFYHIEYSAVGLACQIIFRWRYELDL